MVVTFLFFMVKHYSCHHLKFLLLELKLLNYIFNFLIE